MSPESMTPHQRFLACTRYQPVDRVPLWEWGPWPSTLRRWQREELGEGRKPPQFAECDAHVTCSPDLWMLPRYEKRVIAETDEYVTELTDRGVVTRTLKDPDGMSMPEHVEFPVKTAADWRALKPRFAPDAPGRFPADWAERCARWRAEAPALTFIGPRSPSLFGFVRELMGPERALLAFCDEPELVEDMMETMTELILAVLPRVLDEAPLSGLRFWEDMCFRGGPLISPTMFGRFMVPRYRRITELARSRGVDRIYVDCDGAIDQLVPLWLGAGVNGMFPMEVAAGMDVNAVHREYGKDLFQVGGIDKRVLAQDRRAIDRELDRTLPLAEQGGYIPHLDHAIPHDVPYANFVYYWQRKKEMLGIQP